MKVLEINASNRFRPMDLVDDEVIQNGEEVYCIVTCLQLLGTGFQSASDLVISNPIVVIGLQLHEPQNRPVGGLGSLGQAEDFKEEILLLLGHSPHAQSLNHKVHG